MTTRTPSARPRALRSARLLPLAIGVLLAAAATPAAAESVQTAPVPPATAVALGAGALGDVDVHEGGRVRFENRSATPTCLVFDRDDAAALDCRADGRGAVRSRPGQFLLSSGAALPCRLEQGRYRFETYTQRGGAVRSERAELRVR